MKSPNSARRPAAISPAVRPPSTPTKPPRNITVMSDMRSTTSRQSSEMRPLGIAAQETDGTPDFCNPAVFRRNAVTPRSYHIPDTALSLNGQWSFHHASSPEAAPAPDSEAGTWHAIRVPGHWQLQGHGRPHYTNIQYPFPVCPPFVPTDNPTGTYRRTFYVPSAWEMDVQLRLRFDGIDSAFHVWVNGTLIGYAQGARNPSEFDVTEYVDRKGPNFLHVRVYQWSDGSYIEDQDQWWLSGIFRDVHLMAFPERNRIDDWFVQTDLTNEYKDGSLHGTLSVVAKGDAKLTIVLRELAKNGGEVVGRLESPVRGQQEVRPVDFSIKVKNPKKWTAETPYLYDLELCLSDSSDDKPYFVRQRIGFRKVELRDGLITVNGRPIQFRGVNRHDHHPRFGRAVPLDFIRRDLVLMKTHNINALRCSHYPPHPRLFDMADEIGLWVIDEADLECHGFFDAVSRTLDLPESVSYEERMKKAGKRMARFTSDNPEWEGAYLDRMEQMIQRDKNHPCIIIWSLGNESFYGRNHKKMYDYAKKVDPGRLVHYEGDEKALSADMFSYMYPSVEKLIRLAETEEITQGGVFDKPIILCEYAHAMGNGPGWLEEYHAAFDKYPRLQGGFVWEWANHGLWKDDAATRKGFYAYGGDFGDVPNDGTFVMDGLCFSTHDPTPGLVEYKKVTQPVRLKIEGNDLVVENLYDFLDLYHLVALYKLEEIGQRDSTLILSAGQLDFPPIRPRSSAKISLPKGIVTFKSDNEVFVTISLRLRETTIWADAGHEVAWHQHQVSRADKKTLASSSAVPRGLTSRLDVQRRSQSFIISGLDFSFRFTRSRGFLTSWTAADVPLLEADPATHAALLPSFCRPSTDNDMPTSVPYWRRFGVDALTSQLRRLTIDTSSSSSKITIETHTYVAPPALAWGWDVHSRYTVSATGRLAVSLHLVPRGGGSSATPAHVPRVGLDLRLPRRLSRVAWAGLGPGESYPDKRAAQRVGVWSVDDVAELHTPYEVPQEGGNRMGTRWVEVTEAHGGGLRAVADVGGSGGGGGGGGGVLVDGITPESKGQDKEKGKEKEKEKGKEKEKEADGDERHLFSFRASRYGDAAVQAAKHPCDLVEEEATLLRLDARVAGVGTGACGPGVREDLLVKVEEMRFGFLLERVGI